MTALALAHTERQAMPTLGDAARLIAVLDALLDLGHGELVLHASSLPCATATLCAWASTHELKLSQLASGAVEVCHRDRAHVLAMLYAVTGGAF